MPTPQIPAQVLGMEAAQVPGGDALEGVHQPGQLHGRGEPHEQMHVVVLPVELHQLTSEVLTNLPHDAFTVREYR